MDSTVIAEIANQLGIAVDQAGQFITEHLPEFAELKAMQATIPMIVAWALFAIIAIVSLSSLIMCAHWKRKSLKKQEEEGRRYPRADWEDFASFHVFAWAGLLAILAAFFATMITAFCAKPIRLDKLPRSHAHKYGIEGGGVVAQSAS